MEHMGRFSTVLTPHSLCIKKSKLKNSNAPDLGSGITTFLLRRI
jgi:hypothetical protein